MDGGKMSSAELLETEGTLDTNEDVVAKTDAGGVSAGFFVRKPSWAGGGETVTGSPTSAEALEKAGLDWLVTKEPVFRAIKREGGGPTYRQVKDRFVIVRDKDDSVLGSVGKDYKIFQNFQALDLLDGLAQTDEIEYESAGELYGGKKIWMMCKTPSTLTLAGGDVIQPYMFVSTTHDGSGAITCAATGVRIECANTFTMAISGAKQKVTFRHTNSSETKLQQAREALGLQLTWDAALQKELDQLISTTVTDEQFKAILEANYPAQKVQGPKSIATILENRKVSPTIQDEYRGTAYGCLNSLTEFVEHLRPYRNDEARMKATLLGWGSTLVTQVTRELVKVG